MKNKKTISQESIKNALFVYLSLAIPLLYFIVFVIGLNFSMIIKSFQDANALGQTNGSFCGFDNYKNVILTFLGKRATDSKTNYNAILNSLSILPLALFINLPISLTFSYVIYKKCVLNRFFQITLFIPVVISAVVLCLAFNLVMSYDGIIPKLLIRLGLNNAVPDAGFMGDESTAWRSILVFSVWTGISTNLIYFSSSMGRLPESVLESASIDGASSTRQFFVIVIPLIWPTITTISMTSVASVFGWYLPSLLLTNGNAKTSTIGYIVVINARSLNHVSWTSAFGVLIAVIGTAFTLGFKKLMERLWEDVEY